MARRRKGTFTDFAAWLFPTEDVPAYQRNPSDIPDEVEEVIEQIADDTQIPRDWLEKTAGALVHGLAGLQCLWFLHDAEGALPAEWSPVPRWVDDVRKYAWRSISNDPAELNRGLLEVFTEGTNWPKGTFTFEKGYRSRKPQKQTVKIGRYMERYIEEMTAEGTLSKYQALTMRDDMKRRNKTGMIWRISAHPYDVLTMSFNRPWSSCMHPGSDYKWQYGILTDLAAGSAMMFFYEPGADQPAGRLTLRPGLDRDGAPCILSGRTVYGVGPKGITPEQVWDLLDSAGVGKLRVYEAPLCAWGRQGRALSRLIYSDTGEGGCEQSDSDYERAYERLGSAPWPEPALDVGEMREVATEFVDEMECVIDETISVDLDPEDAAQEIVDWASRDKESASELRDLLQDAQQQFDDVGGWFAAQYPSAESMYDALGADTESELLWAYRSALGNLFGNKLKEEPVLILAFTKSLSDCYKETTDFIDEHISMVWKYKDEETKPWRRPAGWYPDRPDDSIDEALGVRYLNEPPPGAEEFDPAWAAPITSKYYLPAEGDQRQLALFRVRPRELHTIVAVYFDDDVEEALKDEAEEFADGVHPIYDDAVKAVVAEPGTYDWWSYISSLESQ